MKARAEAWQTANYAGPEADARTGASTPTGGQAPQLENAIGSGIASAQQAKLIAAQVAQAESAAELNRASAMKARAEAWQTANFCMVCVWLECGNLFLGLVYRDWETDRKSTRLNSSHSAKSRMPSSA